MYPSLLPPPSHGKYLGDDYDFQCINDNLLARIRF